MSRNKKVLCIIVASIFVVTSAYKQLDAIIELVDDLSEEYTESHTLKKKKDLKKTTY